MDFKNLTATCGRDCFNCPYYQATKNEELRNIMAKKLSQPVENIPCKGCRNNNGICNALKFYGLSGNCKIRHCAQNKNVEFCFECESFPCHFLQPVSDRAERLPHNMKVFNLCKIQKLGVEEWAQNHAKVDFDNYYSLKLKDCID